MASINKVIIVGHLGRDPEKRFMSNNEAVTTVSVATTERWRDKSTNEMKEITEWHRVSFFGRLAETASQHLKKGSQVYVEGRLRTRKYTGKDGVERSTTEILADVMQNLERKQESRPNDSFQDQDIPF